MNNDEEQEQERFPPDDDDGDHGPLNALADEHRFLKPGKEARFLPGALTTGTGNPTTGTRSTTIPHGSQAHG